MLPGPPTHLTPEKNLKPSEPKMWFSGILDTPIAPKTVVPFLFRTSEPQEFSHLKIQVTTLEEKPSTEDRSPQLNGSQESCGSL